MSARLAPEGLWEGYVDDWPPTCRIGMLLEAVEAGNPINVAAAVARLDPRAVRAWAEAGTAYLTATRGRLERVSKPRWPFATFALRLESAEARCESTLRSVVMAEALGGDKDAWRAASWLLDHRAPPAPAVEYEEADDDLPGLGAPVLVD